MSASDPPTTSTPAMLSSHDSRRGSIPTGATKRTKNAVPSPSAIPPYDSVRPAISRSDGGGAASTTWGTGGGGTVPVTKAEVAFRVGPATPLGAVHATQDP